MGNLKKWWECVKETSKLEVGYRLCSLGLVILCSFQMYALLAHNASSIALFIATLTIWLGLEKIEA